MTDERDDTDFWDRPRALENFERPPRHRFDPERFKPKRPPLLNPPDPERLLFPDEVQAQFDAVGIEPNPAHLDRAASFDTMGRIRQEVVTWLLREYRQEEGKRCSEH